MLITIENVFFSIYCQLSYPLISPSYSDKDFKKIDVRSRTHPRCIVAALLIKLYLIKTFLKSKVSLHIFITRKGIFFWEIFFYMLLSSRGHVSLLLCPCVCMYSKISKTDIPMFYFSWRSAGSGQVLGYLARDTLTSLRKLAPRIKYQFRIRRQYNFFSSATSLPLNIFTLD